MVKTCPAVVLRSEVSYLTAKLHNFSLFCPLSTCFAPPQKQEADSLLSRPLLKIFCKKVILSRKSLRALCRQRRCCPDIRRSSLDLHRKP